MTHRNPTDPQPTTPDEGPARLDPRRSPAAVAKRCSAAPNASRRTVAAATAALFAAAFLAIYVQLASGHDPALSSSSKTQHGRHTERGHESQHGHGRRIELLHRQ